MRVAVIVAGACMVASLCTPCRGRAESPGAPLGSSAVDPAPDAGGAGVEVTLMERVQTLEHENEALHARVALQDERLSKLEHGSGQVLADLLPRGLGALALGLVPLGFVVARARLRVRQ